MRCSFLAFLGVGLLLGTPKYAEETTVGDPLSRLSPAERERFQQGRKVFERRFTPEDGLGPLFNAEGCISCHVQPVAGGGSDVTEVHASRFSSSDGCDPLFQQGGPVIQSRATPLLQAAGVERESLPPGATGQALRSTPPLFGLGLVDGIAENTILVHEDRDDRDRDGISGRANRFIDGRVGRFGRKAFIPRLSDFNAGAFVLEQGVTTPFQPEEESINGTPVPPGTDPAAEPEVSLAEVAAVDDFVRFLAPPPQAPVSGNKKAVKRGEKIFEQIGCATCHVPSMRTGKSKVGGLDKKDVFLYSDLLLHDMGSESADICLGLATPTEFRTELLMGLRFRRQLMHDGSAKTPLEAIEAHGGEALQSRKAFSRLEQKDRLALLSFLNTI